MTERQLKLGLVTTGVGGPGQTNRWLGPEIPVDASVNIDWYIASRTKLAYAVLLARHPTIRRA